MKNNNTESYTTRFWHREATANKSAKLMSNVHGRYFTSIKGQPFEKFKPEECWAITDKYDRSNIKPLTDIL